MIDRLEKRNYKQKGETAMKCELCNREIKSIPYYNITEKKHYDMECVRLIELLKDEGFRDKISKIIDAFTVLYGDVNINNVVRIEELKPQKKKKLITGLRNLVGQGNMI